MQAFRYLEVWVRMCCARAWAVDYTFLKKKEI